MKFILKINIKYVIKKILFILILKISLIMIKQKKNTFKGVAMCVIAKNENLYINEFINYYKKLGINKIYLYDNNDIFGENFIVLLKKDIKSKFVEIINIRGKNLIQNYSYNDCYKKHLNDYSWFIIVDVDEYLYIKNGVSLYNFLNDKKFENCNNILINHKMYGDSDLLYYDKRPLYQRFTKNYKYKNFMKSIVRGGLIYAKMWLHKSLNISNYCDSEGNNIVPRFSSTKKLNIKNAEIRHYFTKTIGEYYLKLLRGWPDRKKSFRDLHSFIDFRIRNFFTLNKITKEKIEIIYPLLVNKKLLNNLLERLNKTESHKYLNENIFR